MRLTLLLASLLSFPVLPMPTPVGAPRAAPKRSVRAIAPPLFFEQNIGQTNDEARFVIRQAHRAFFFTKTGIVVKLTEPPDSVTKRVPGKPLRRPRTTGLRMSFVGGAIVEPNGEAPYRAIVRQNEPKGGSGRGSIVPAYHQVRYAEVYPGTDIVYYEQNGQLRYDIVLKPGADPSRVRFHIDGARAVAVEENGNLVIQTVVGDVVQGAPRAYQEKNGRRLPVRSAFVVKGGREVSFRADDWDRKRPLVIDPVVYVRLLAPTVPSNQFDHVSADNSGNLFVIGYVSSPTFQSTDGSVLQGAEDVIVYRFDVSNPASPTLVYARYLGGIGADIPGDVAASGEGEVFVAGTTDGSITPGASACTGPSGEFHTCGFVTRLDDLGAVIADAIVDGGAGSNTQITGIAVREGSSISAPGVYVIGSTDGSGRAGALRPSAGSFDGFVAKLKTSLHAPAVVWFSYLGGSSDEYGAGIHVAETSAPATLVYLTGRTSSTDFPTRTCSGGSQPGNAGGTRGFAAVVDAVSGTLRCATYVQVTDAQDDYGEEITATSDGIATVVGGAGNNALIARVNADGVVAFARAVGGGSTLARAVTQDGTGKPVVVGRTSAAGMSTPGAIQSAPLGYDAFLGSTSLSSGSFVDFTYLGANGADEAKDVAVATSGYTYIVGFTSSDPFRVGGVDPVGDRAGSSSILFNSFLLVLGPSAPVAAMVTIDTHHDWPDPVTIGTPVDYFAVLMRNEAPLAVGDSVVHHLGAGAHLRSSAVLSPACETNAAADRVACALIGFFTPDGLGAFNLSADVTIAGESCDDLELKGPSFSGPVHDPYCTHVNPAPVVEVRPAALTVTKTVQEMSDGFITYGIVINNTGTLPAIDVVFTDFETVVDEPHRRLHFTSAKSADAVCTVTLLNVTCPLGTISGSSSRHINVRAKILRDGPATNTANVVFGSGIGNFHTITTEVRLAPPRVDVLLRMYPPTMETGAGNTPLQSFAVSVLEVAPQPTSAGVNVELEFQRETCFETNTNPPRHICSSGTTPQSTVSGGQSPGLTVTITQGGGGCNVTNGSSAGISLVRCYLYPNAQTTAYQWNIQVVNQLGSILRARGFVQQDPLVVDPNRTNNCASWPVGQPCLH